MKVYVESQDYSDSVVKSIIVTSVMLL